MICFRYQSCGWRKGTTTLTCGCSIDDVTNLQLHFQETDIWHEFKNSKHGKDRELQSFHHKSGEHFRMYQCSKFSGTSLNYIPSSTSVPNSCFLGLLLLLNQELNDSHVNFYFMSFHMAAKSLLRPCNLPSPNVRHNETRTTAGCPHRTRFLPSSIRDRKVSSVADGTLNLCIIPQRFSRSYPTYFTGMQFPESAKAKTSNDQSSKCCGKS